MNPRVRDGQLTPRAVSEWVVRYHPNEQTTCPARERPTFNAAVARTKLEAGVSCDSIRDRALCCGSIDGRTSAIHLNQPCLAAQVQFLDGSLCQTARYVKDLDPLASASCQEFNSPHMEFPIGDQETLVHEVQEIALRQTSPVRLSQLIHFHAEDCPANKSTSHADCANPTSGWVRLTHNGKESRWLWLATATPTQITQAFEPLRDKQYSGVTVTVVSASSSKVVWRLELVTPYESCTKQHTLPLLGTIRRAKVNSTTTFENTASCLHGGVSLGLDGSQSTVFLPHIKPFLW